MTWQEKIYDFETAMEDGFSALFEAAGLSWVTPRKASKFQHERSRVGLRFRTGLATQSKHVVAQDGNHLRNASWSGTLELDVITASATDDADSDSSHRSYRALVRAIMATAIYDLNDTEATALPYHRIQNIVEQSVNVSVSPEQGYEKSNFTYAVAFGIDADSWTEITA